MSTMKTAEELSLPLVNAICDNKCPNLIDFIKQIQLNAYLAGMTEAVEICHNSIQPTAPYFKTLIEAARDRKDLSL